MPRDLIIDSFAGGGGASEGIRAAIGRDPDVAINHDRLALAMHRINHPDTHHLVEDVWHVDPRKTCGERRIGLFWMSPDCFPAGTPAQEMGGTLNTLAALAAWAGLDMMACAEAELARTMRPEIVAKIRHKRANRHGRGVLPGDDADLITSTGEARR